MAEIYQEDRLRERWDMLTAIAEKALPALREAGDDNVDLPVGEYATTHGHLHARIAAAIAVMENTRLGKKRLATEFSEHLRKHHREELQILREEIIAATQPDLQQRSTGGTTRLGRDIKITMWTTNIVNVDGSRHHAKMELSSEVTHAITNPGEPVRIEDRHIDRATEMLRQDLRENGDPEWETRDIRFGMTGEKPGRRDYGEHDDVAPVEPYRVPLTVKPDRKWNHGTPGRIAISAPRRLILDQHGQVAEADESRSFHLTAYDLVHDVPSTLKHALSNASGNVCQTLQRRARAREHADTISRRILELMGASKGATTLKRYMVEHERSRVTATVDIEGYCTGSYRAKTYRIKTYDQRIADTLKSLENMISAQIAADNAILAKMGRPPIPHDKDVDLGLYTIDRPLLRLLSRGDAVELIEHAVRSDGALPDGAVAALGQSVTITLDRGWIKGTFDLSDAVEWRKGRLKLHGSVLPAAVRNALVGMPASALAVHPLLDDAMTIASFQEMTKDGRTDTYVRFQEGAVPAIDAA